jgi:hypothetical protein
MVKYLNFHYSSFALRYFRAGLQVWQNSQPEGFTGNRPIHAWLHLAWVLIPINKAHGLDLLHYSKGHPSLDMICKR